MIKVVEFNKLDAKVLRDALKANGVKPRMCRRFGNKVQIEVSVNGLYFYKALEVFEELNIVNVLRKPHTKSGSGEFKEGDIYNFGGCYQLKTV